MRVQEEWTQTTVGEVLERVADPVVVDPSKIYQEIGIRSHGKGLFDKEPVSGAVLGEKRVFWIQPDCFILNIVFAWERAVGRTTVEDVGKIASHRFPMYRPKSGLADVDYVLHFFKTERGRELLALASPGGAGRNKTLGQKEFLKLPLCLPPLREQRRIAEILSSIDEAIETTRAVIEQSGKVKQGVLNRLLTRGMGHGHFKQTEFGLIPEKWEVVPLRTVAHVQTGVAKGKKDIQDPVELPYLRVANVQDGHIDLTELKTITVSASQVERYSLRPGDVLMTEGGDFDKLGRGDVWKGQVPVCLHQNHVFAVRPDQELLVSEFLAALTASAHGKSYFLSCAKQTTNLASINSTQVKDFPVLLPGKEEQERIVQQVAAHALAERSASDALAQLEQTKAALMSNLLTGRKRVSADALSPAL
ncbi:restriction endonuclease subunit S [Azospirillum sp.]|uniref:restriction endonuclease subunit S n=1 Tax=Azospirillum sp. TaxID=34012 RepID=UPI002D3FF17C|nr:restriction endonuclease subunit S [Azospirillum sp.]HYD66680.1 restriction endonuclease subunit S [Azospirillum sp.]